MFGDELRLEATFTVTRNLYRQLAKLALKGLLTFAIARVATGIADSFIFIVT